MIAKMLLDSKGNYQQNEKATEAKINKLVCIQKKSLSTAKEIINKIKTTN